MSVLNTGHGTISSEKIIRRLVMLASWNLKLCISKAINHIHFTYFTYIFYISSQWLCYKIMTNNILYIYVIFYLYIYCRCVRAYFVYLHHRPRPWFAGKGGAGPHPKKEDSPPVGYIKSHLKRCDTVFIVLTLQKTITFNTSTAPLVRKKATLCSFSTIKKKKLKS